MRWVLFVVALAGCDKIIGLDYHDPGPEPGNEDGDAKRDDDDNCPGISNDQKDTDGDSVGDACDPSATGDDRIAVFYGFNAQSDPAWFADGGAWAFVEGQLTYANTGSGSHHFFTKHAPKLTPPMTVEAHFTIEEMEGFSVFAVTASVDDLANDAACGIRRSADGTFRVEAYWDEVVKAAGIAPVATNDGYRVRFTVAAPTILCDMKGDTLGQGGVASNDTYVPQDGYVGFGTLNSLSVRVDYLVVYDKN